MVFCPYHLIFTENVLKAKDSVLAILPNSYSLNYNTFIYLFLLQHPMGINSINWFLVQTSCCFISTVLATKQFLWLSRRLKGFERNIILRVFLEFHWSFNTLQLAMGTNCWFSGSCQFVFWLNRCFKAPPALLGAHSEAVPRRGSAGKPCCHLQVCTHWRRWDFGVPNTCLADKPAQTAKSAVRAHL